MMSWRRLEGTNVDPEMTEGLSARLADPLWALARQWQVGEFHGEDAASPILVSAEVDAIPLAGVQAGPHRRPAGQYLPLEALVEAETVRQGPAAIRMRLESGEALLDRLRVMPAGGDAIGALLTAYPVDLALLERLDDLDPVGAARLRFLARRTIDSGSVRADFVSSGRDASAMSVVQDLGGTRAATLAAIIEAWVVAEDSLFDEVEDDSPVWIDHRLEYRFGALALGEDDVVHLDAPEYPGGSLDWFHFDVATVKPQKGTAKPEEGTASNVTHAAVEVLASPVQFAGQPASRFWEFEDGDVDFGDLAGGPEDLARSVIAAFATVAGDDWLLVPVTLPVGTLARVQSVHVLDDFGGRHEIRSTAENDSDAAAAGTRPASRPWRFFELHGDSSADAAERRAPMLFLPPVLDALETSVPVEAVEFRRDEMANLAWAIERRVESPWGRAVDRDSAIAPPSPPTPGVWDYTLMTTVPASWVPLVPVQRTGNLWPQIALRRGRIAHARGDETAPTDPRSVLLHADEPFILEEEEVPHGGVRVTRRYQMARDSDGGVHVWVGRRKAPASGPMRRTPLRFDRLRESAVADQSDE
jgi:hypothetical protein